MDVRKLEAFAKVYEFKSFSKAGDAMFLSQPTISSHVANLEDTLGIKLFDRMGRNVVPTSAGDVLYGSCCKIFEQLDHARSSIEMLRDKVVGELHIGCSTIPSQNIVPRIVAGFSSKYPDVSFNISTADSTEILQCLSDGTLPIGFVGQKAVDSDLEYIPLIEDDMVIVAAADAPWLPDETTMSVEQVVQLPWVAREQGSATRHSLDRALGLTGFSFKNLNVRVRVEGSCETLAHVVNGVGVTVTSELACKEYLESGRLVRLDIPELQGKRQFFLAYNRSRHQFPALKAFIEFVK